MTANDDSTMAASKATGVSFKEVVCTKKSNRLKPIPVQKIPVKQTFKKMICVYFPAPPMQKFNLIQ